MRHRNQADVKSPGRSFNTRVMNDTDNIANTPEARLGSVTLAFGWDETKQRFQKACTIIDQIAEDDHPAVENAEQQLPILKNSVVSFPVFCLSTGSLVAGKITTLQTSIQLPRYPVSRS